MTIHQLSIFLENKSNALVNVLRLFKKLEIQLIASTISDTADNGIYRVICSEPLRAYKGLKESGVTVALSDVFAIELDDIPGRASDAMEILSNAGIGITYMYTFLLRGKGILIFRTTDANLTRETIILNDMKFVAEKDLSKWV